MPGTPVGHVIKTLELSFEDPALPGTPVVVSCAINSAHFLPGGRAKQTRGTACGPAVDYGLPEDSLDVGYNVDLTEGSFHRFLIEHEGEEWTAALVDGHSGVTQTGLIRVLPGTPSGAMGEFAAGTVSLAVIGPITIEDPV
jgi:hypothetical protein